MIDSKFKALIEYSYNRLLIMIRNWDVLEEWSTSGCGSVMESNLILERQRFNFTTGICSNISYVGCPSWEALQPYDKYNFREFYIEYMNYINAEWCKVVHGHAVEDIRYLISGKSEYTKTFAQRRFYANPKRLHYAIYLSNKFQYLLTSGQLCLK